MYAASQPRLTFPIVAAALASGQAAAASFPALYNDLTVPVLGTSIVSVGAAMFGTLAAGAWSEPIKPGAQLYWVVFGSVVLACTTASVLPAFGFEWAKAAPQGPLCAILAAVYRLFMGAAVSRSRQLIGAFNPFDWLPSRRNPGHAASPIAEERKPPAPPAGE